MKAVLLFKSFSWNASTVQKQHVIGVQDFGTNEQLFELFDDGAAGRWIDEQVLIRRGRLGVQGARTELAREMRLAPGAIERIHRGRRKNLPARIRDAIYSHKIKFLQSQIAAIEYELAVTCRMGANLRAADHSSILAHVEAARALITKMRATLAGNNSS